MLRREEYIEQAYFFRILAERIPEGVPLQEILEQAKQETLASTNLPMAIDFLLGELVHSGAIGPAMAKISHYFSPFQAYVMSEAESEQSRFDVRIAIPVLQQLAVYLASPDFSLAGMFLYQFEVLCRNRLRYDGGLQASADDPSFDEPWREWIRTVRRQVGLVDFAQLVYLRSEHYREQAERRGETLDRAVLFGEQAGKIARANIGKDPIYLFAALQRHLGYPGVPRPKLADPLQNLLPLTIRRVDKLELRMKMLEEEQRHDSIDLERFYQSPPDESK